MPTLMFDSDQVSVLLEPRLAGCRVSTYADLLTPDLARQLAGRLVVIDRGFGDPLGLATVADIEPGLLTPDAGAAKIRAWTAEHRPDPTVYHDRAQWEEVTDACAPLRPWHWVATLDGTGDPDGLYPAVVQIVGAAQLGFHADMSIVWDDRWHPLPPDLPGTSLHQLRAFAAALGADAAGLSHLVARL